MAVAALLAETDSFARVLSVAALVVSLGGVLVAVASYRRDTAELVVTLSLGSLPAAAGQPHDHRLSVTITNGGRRPESVAAVSLCSYGAGCSRRKVRVLVRQPWLQRWLAGPVVWGRGPDAGPSLPLVLQPAETQTFEFLTDDATATRQQAHDEHNFVSVVTPVGRELRRMVPRLGRVVPAAENELQIY
jgi:hypothetical protein